MTEIGQASSLESPDGNAPQRGTPDSDQPKISPSKGGRSRARYLGLAVLLLLIGALSLGVWRHYVQHWQAIIAAEQRRDFVPSVRTEAVAASGSVIHVELPGTTSAFDAANIYSRASGYINKRYVDIGSRVKTGQLLVEITAPEVDDQIAQAEATLVQTKASLRQVSANRELARVTNGRTTILVGEGWATKQQGDTDRLTYEAQQHAAQVAEANIQAQQAQLNVLRQQKIYQQVVAPFDGVVTQRNIDVGSLVQADATSGTFLFTMMHSDVMRIQLYVPQDQAFGVAPGVEAVVRVPEMPKRSFKGKVTDRGCDSPRNPDSADRNRCAQSGWSADPGCLLHRRAAGPAQDAFPHRSRRRGDLQSRRAARCRGREWHRPYAQHHDCARFWQGGRSPRRRRE